jgi:hypothetical protein
LCGSSGARDFGWECIAENQLTSKTSFQHLDRSILVDGRFNTGKETLQTRILLGPRHSMRQGLSMNFYQLKSTPEQRRES